MIGIINGGLTESSHETGFLPVPGGGGFNSRDQMHGGGWKPDGAMAFMGVTGTDFNLYNWWTTDASLISKPGTQIPNDKIWTQPRGRWVGREIYVKMNSENSISDGIYRATVFDPVDSNGVIVREESDILWTEDVVAHKWDGIHMYSRVGGNPADIRNILPQEQAIYYDNFKVSDRPIARD
jgi:hypothetical protein